jgi:hypothetical protein
MVAAYDSLDGNLDMLKRARTSHWGSRWIAENHRAH